MQKSVIKKLSIICDETSVLSAIENLPNFTIFESQENTVNKLNRYSIYLWDSILSIEVNEFGAYVREGTTVTDIEDPLIKMEDICTKYRYTGTLNIDCCSDVSVPFMGGFAGFISYDYHPFLEKNIISHNVSANYSNTHIPLLCFHFYENSLIFDKFEKCWYLTSIVSFDNLKEKEICLQSLLNSTINNKLNASYNCASEIEMISSVTKKEYLSHLQIVHNNIKQGTVYQINYTQRFVAENKKTPNQIYNYLAKHNPAPFSAYIKSKDYTIVSSSPERFLKVSNRIITTRPIKGTIKKTKDPKLNLELKDQLFHSTKDRAELLMIVDLERNDFGKICKFGSITVPQLFCIEEYPTLYHLVSEVQGELRDDVKFSNIIKSTFPGGSITGAPKIAAMQCISDLEKVPRELYTGTIGYLDVNGDLDLNIVIRTIICVGNKAFFSSGGGITWDSDQESEYSESLLKIKALKEALCFA